MVEADRDTLGKILKITIVLLIPDKKQTLWTNNMGIKKAH